MHFRARTLPEPSKFQMTPLLDCIALLLCFSITVQIFARWETEVDITLPTAQTGELPRRLPGEIILNIRDDGAVIFNGRRMGDDELASLLQRVVKDWPDQPVLIRGDAKTAYRNVVKVLDICRQVDMWNISFATGVPEKKP